MNNSEDKQVAAWNKVIAALNADQAGISEADQASTAQLLLDGSDKLPEKMGESDTEAMPPAA